MIKVNLLSPEKKEVSGAGPEGAPFTEEERESKINTGAIIAAAVLTFGIIGAMYFTQAATYEAKQELLKEKKARKAELDTVLKEIAELEKASKDLDQKVKLIGDLKNRQEDAVRMMDELVDAIPDWVWLTSLQLNGGNLNLVGKAINNNLISDFINALKGTGCFYDIEFPGSMRQTEAGQDVFNFRLTCKYRQKAEKKGAAPEVKK